MLKVIIAALIALAPVLAHAQARPDYGPSVNLETGKRLIAAALDEARKNKWNVAVAIVDTAGNLVAFERLDQTQTASMQIAIDKAVSAAIYRRSTKVFEDAVAKGGAGVRLMNLPRASMLEGGLPLFVDGKVVGGIGVSGVNADQDGMIAKAGADTLK